MNKIIQGDCLDKLKELELYYEITPSGFLVSKRTQKPLSFSTTHKGYLKARVYCPKISTHKDKRKPMFLHRIIAMKFLPDYSEKLQVNHINGNKQDNRIENLEMVTNAKNAWHGWNILDSKNRRLSLTQRNYARASK